MLRPPHSPVTPVGPAVLGMRQRLHVSALALFFCAPVSRASAQDATAPATAPATVTATAPATVTATATAPVTVTATATATAPATETAHDDTRYTDASADRVILSSTAETQPAGTFFVSDYELAAVELGYAFTDHAQVEITSAPPFLKEQLFFFDLSLKLNVYRGSRWRTALVGSLTAAFDPASDDTIVGGRLAAIETLCFTRTCGTSLSASITAFPNDDTSQFLPVYGALGLTIRLSSLVSILVEPSYLFVIGDSGIQGINGVLFGGGIRLSGRNFGVDLSLLRGLGSAFDGINDTLVLGIPFLAFTYRTDGSWADAPAPPPSRAAPARARAAP